MPYLGAGPGVGQAQTFTFVATAGQTAFSGTDSLGNTLNYTAGAQFTSVYVNGWYTPASDYTAADGSTITLGAALIAGDVVSVVSMSVYSPANTYTTAQADTKFAPMASGTITTFQQTAAPTGWTKVTTYNDCGLRVVSGTCSSVTGATAFSTVFAQTTTGTTTPAASGGPSTNTTDGHTLSIAEIPAHAHPYDRTAYNAPSGAIAGGTDYYENTVNDGYIGGGAAHTHTMGSHTHTAAAHNHTVALNLNYVDLILASKN